jgi:hypothetical protein
VNVCLQDEKKEVSEDFDDFTDGIVFILLIEHLSGQPFGKFNRTPRFPGTTYLCSNLLSSHTLGHKLDNISLAYRWLENNWKIKIPSNPSGITN